MRKKVAGIPLYFFAIVVVILLAVIVVGSFLDLQISERFAVLDNPFGKVVALVGKYPGYALLGLSGVLFFLSRQDKKGPLNVAISWALLLGIAIGAGALYGFDDIDEYLNDKVISVLIGIVAIAPAEVLLYFLFRKANQVEAFNASMAMLFIGILTIGMSYLLKTAALRPRYSWLAETNNLSNYYQTWYSFSSAAREAFPDALESDFASWPSAHTAMASVTVAMILFPRLNSKLTGKEMIFFLSSFLWTVLVAIGRMSDGSHFLSDVGWGALIGLLLSFLVIVFIYTSPKASAEQAVANSGSNATTVTTASPAQSPEPKNSGNPKKKTKDKGFEIDV